MKRLLLILWLLTAAAGSRISAAGRTELNQGWKFRQYGLGEWLPAAVPGTVHTDLLANGQIPDPFYGSSQSDLQWIDKTDWEYCCTFDAPELASYDNVRLVFEGVDCYADIRLNGELLHRTGNMFRTWKSDVKGLLKSRNNRLHVVFHSPVMQGLKNMAAYGSRLTANNDLGALGGLGPNKVSVFTRKSGYQYGWDLAPRYVTSGLWRPVALEAWNEARVEDFHVRTRSTGPRKAQMSASAALRTDAAGCYRIRILLNGKSILTADKTLDAGTHSIEEPFEIPSPRLWYPNGMGEPYLYDVELVLEKEGRELDRTAVRCGVRTVSLRCRDDADGRGRGFGFEINGIPVFCKGSNYVPADAFLPRISREKTEFLVRSAAQANMNMLRVWGGGTYESDDFYEMCDRYGIMEWQDFVFACNMYPGSAQIYADIRAEAEDNVRRLRNHPSLVLWCGNNEIDVAWKPHDKRNSRFRKFYTEEEAEQFDRVNETIFRNILPGVVDSLCGGTVPYWHSSPSPGWGLDTADRWRYGDVHNWDVWHKGDPISAYNTQIARFISEYGLQSYPELSSVERFIPEGERRLASPSMTSHQGDRKKGDIPAQRRFRTHAVPQPIDADRRDEDGDGGASAQHALLHGVAHLAAQRRMALRQLVGNRLLRPVESHALLCKESVRTGRRLPLHPRRYARHFRRLRPAAAAPGGNETHADGFFRQQAEKQLPPRDRRSRRIAACAPVRRTRLSGRYRPRQRGAGLRIPVRQDRVPGFAVFRDDEKRRTPGRGGPHPRREARRSDLPDHGEQRQTGEESHPALQGYGGNLLRQLFRPAAGRKPERHAYGAGRCRRDPATHRMYGTQPSNHNHKAMMHLKRIALPAGFAALAISQAAAQPAAPVPVARNGEKPRNVIFILSDDHRYDFMGFTGAVPWLQTPALDRMAREGACLKNAFVTTSLSSPSRASILTGLFTHTHTVVDNQAPKPDDLVFFPQYLQQNGYRTAFFGKWHMGNQDDMPQP